VVVHDDFVALTSRFTSGWPWPESSWGLEPMYGPGGWCAACGVPNRDQIGGLVLQGSKFPTSDFWMPNWAFNALCVRTAAAEPILATFRVRTLHVRTPRSADVGVAQLVPEVAPAPWFDETDLATRARRRHGATGRLCASCGTWRWLPVPTEELPPAALGMETAKSDFIAGPEWFGDGMKAMRELRFRRPVAEALVALNPRVWRVVEPPRR
jgi:hypothetical protein